MKKTVCFGLLAIMLVFGFIGCDNGDNEKTYTVTIGTLTNGSITANPTSGVSGTEITLTVNPDNLYRLKSDTLKYGSTAIDETTLKFNLPASNVTVTADFELKFIGTWELSFSFDGILFQFLLFLKIYLLKSMLMENIDQKVLGDWRILIYSFCNIQII